jgi:hypothetical protein
MQSMLQSMLKLSTATAVHVVKEPLKFSRLIQVTRFLEYIKINIKKIIDIHKLFLRTGLYRNSCIV